MPFLEKKSISTKPAIRPFFPNQVTYTGKYGLPTKITHKVNAVILISGMHTENNLGRIFINFKISGKMFSSLSQIPSLS